MTKAYTIRRRDTTLACLTNTLFPLKLGPVMTARLFSSSRYVSLGMKVSQVNSAKGWRPSGSVFCVCEYGECGALV